MEKSKKIFWGMAVVIVVLLIIIVGLISFQFGRMKEKKSQVDQVSDSVTDSIPAGFSPDKNGTQEEAKMYFSDKKNIPQVITGVIDSIDDKKIVIKQFSSVDLSYEISKDDVSSVNRMKINPSFDKEKADKFIEENKANFASKSNANQNINPEGSKTLEETDSSLQMFIDEKISWNDLEKGSQVNIIKDSDGKEKISVFPKDFSIAPPGTASNQ